MLGDKSKCLSYCCYPECSLRSIVFTRDQCLSKAVNDENERSLQSLSFKEHSILLEGSKNFLFSNLALLLSCFLRITKMPFLELPVDVMNSILHYLDIYSLLALSASCRLCRSIVVFTFLKSGRHMQFQSSLEFCMVQTIWSTERRLDS